MLEKEILVERCCLGWGQGSPKCEEVWVREVMVEERRDRSGGLLVVRTELNVNVGLLTKAWRERGVPVLAVGAVTSAAWASTAGYVRASSCMTRELAWVALEGEGVDGRRTPSGGASRVLGVGKYVGVLLCGPQKNSLNRL